MTGNWYFVFFSTKLWKILLMTGSSSKGELWQEPNSFQLKVGTNRTSWMFSREGIFIEAREAEFAQVKGSRKGISKNTNTKTKHGRA